MPETFRINLEKDAPIYQKDSSGSVFRVATFRQGSPIVIGDADTIVKLSLDNEKHEFMPIPGDLADSDDDVKDGDYFIRTIDLPQDF